MPSLRPPNYKGLLLILAIIVITDLAIVFDIPILRQVSGAFLVFILPGLLILFLLKLHELGTAEKMVLTIGLSTAFLMVFGWILSSLCLQFGYLRPLDTTTLMLALSGILILLAFASYAVNREAFSPSVYQLELNTTSKLYLLLPLALPLVSILGVHYLNISGNNVVLLTLIFLVAIPIIILNILGRKISNDAYPLTIISISSAMLIIYWLRSEYIMGHDVHSEYYMFQMTLANYHWSILGHSTLDSCLSVSVLPAVVQSLLDVSKVEYFFKGIYVLVCIFMPLTVYVISKKYIGERLSILAAFYSIAQLSFLITPGSPRTNVAILFFALCIMALFHSEIIGRNRKTLFLIFVTATIISHYSTTYIFLILVSLTYLASLVWRKSYTSRAITLTGIGFSLALTFLWYGQVVQVPFQVGVRFISMTFTSFLQFFSVEARSHDISLLFGSGLAGESTLMWVQWAVTWLSFVLIFVGVLGTLLKHKRMIGTSQKRKRMTSTSRNVGVPPTLLRAKFETEYFLMSLVGGAIMVAMLVLPYVSTGYDIFRVYSQMAVLLSVFLVLGGVMLSNWIRLNSYLLIWLVLLPFFLFATWLPYELSGTHKSLLLSSESPAVKYEIVHDQETSAALWLKDHLDENSYIYTADMHGRNRLISQGNISPNLIDPSDSFTLRREIDGYLYLNYNNVVNKRLVDGTEFYDINTYSDMIVDKNRLYTNGGSEFYQ